jgi:DUF4097 and DUF4098 domain-containing protein YvlB
MKPTLLAFGTLILCACHVSLHDHLEVDGVRLEHHHEEVLTLEAWPESGLVIESRRGDLRVERAEGPTSLRVVVHERAPGEAHAHIQDGQLLARARDGGVCAIGDVLLRTPGPVRGLVLATGMGDVEVVALAVEGRITLSSGMGDIELSAAGSPGEVELESGMGDIEVRNLACTRLAAATGMGDIEIEDVEAGSVALESGLGDVEVARSRGGRLEASSGMGDVDVRESNFETRTLDTGLGSVRQRE